MYYAIRLPKRQPSAPPEVQVGMLLSQSMYEDFELGAVVDSGRTLSEIAASHPRGFLGYFLRGYFGDNVASGRILAVHRDEYEHKLHIDSDELGLEVALALTGTPPPIDPDTMKVDFSLRLLEPQYDDPSYVVAGPTELCRVFDAARVLVAVTTEPPSLAG